MKFLDFTDLLKSEPALFAALSTFTFDVDYFERRLLRTKALAKARQIVVFMDAGQWIRLLRRQAPARLLNRRYLVVPMRAKTGVFHPKLHLLIHENGGQLMCGSNNLTRCGCASNLELMNSLPFSVEAHSGSDLGVMQDAYRFFLRACENAADEMVGAIALKWLTELMHSVPWLGAEVKQEPSHKVRLLHTYDGSLWDAVTAAIGSAPPQRLLIVSPFYDADAALLRRVHRTWPKCSVEIVAQQETSTLPVEAMKSLARQVSLYETRMESRRLHAKLLAWQSPKGSGCIVGSANFTTAAFDARNVEACLLVSNVEREVASLFDKQLPRRAIALKDFIAGTDSEPSQEDDEQEDLVLQSAVLTEEGNLKVAYCHRLSTTPEKIRVAISIPGQTHPNWFRSVPNKASAALAIPAPHKLTADARGAIMAWLEATVGKEKRMSSPTWVVQESSLIHEYGNIQTSNPRAKVEETGAGLTELLDEIGQREGLEKVAEYLDALNIRFTDGEGSFRTGSRFRLKVRDPYESDELPDWLVADGAASKAVAEAIYDFVERHDRRRLRRHAKRGNINGIANFLDIFTVLVRLLLLYHGRGFVPSNQVIGRVLPMIQIAVAGLPASDDESEGFLSSVSMNLRNTAYLQDVCDEHGMLAHIRAAFMILQRIRAPLDNPPSRPRDCLVDKRYAIRNAIRDLKLKEPSFKQVAEALKSFAAFTEQEMTTFESEYIV